MFVALLFLATAGSAPPATDVLAQIRAGKVLCTNPDPATKTCSTIDSFMPGQRGELLDTGEVLISPDQQITLETSSIVQVDGPTICGALQLEDLQNGKLRVQGAPLPPDRNAEALSKLAEKLKPLTGRKVCEGLRIEDGHLVRYGEVERVDLPLPAKPVSWISRADGYRVAPR